MLMLMLMMLMSSLTVRGQLGPSMVATSCSSLPESEWNSRDIAAHLKSWLTGLVTIRNLRLLLRETDRDANKEFKY